MFIPAKIRNIETRGFGGLKEPSWIESIAAFYIIFISTKFTSKYYKLVFFLNGLSSSFAHSPFFSRKYPFLQKKINEIDGITIYFPLFFEVMKSKNDTININILLFIIVFNLFININKYFEYLSIFSSIKILLKIYRKFNFYSYLIILTSLLAKYYENIILFKFYNIKIKMHTVWHILGSHMFQELIYLNNE